MRYTSVECDRHWLCVSNVILHLVRHGIPHRIATGRESSCENKIEKCGKDFFPFKF